MRKTVTESHCVKTGSINDANITKQHITVIYEFLINDDTWGQKMILHKSIKNIILSCYGYSP